MGSEMCIRDRVSSLQDIPVPRDICFAGEVGLSGEIRPVQQLDKRCLLYTSDAADERSSVDLGGRRIIKKKQAMKTTVPPLYETR